MASLKSSRSRGASHTGGAVKWSSKDAGTKFEENINVFKSDNFDADTFFQSKSQSLNEKNGNVGSIQKQQESLLFGGGRSNGDAIKFSGTKQMTPEFLSGLPGHLSLAYNGENENVKNARLRFQLELDRGRQQKMDIYTDNPKSRNMYQLPQDISQKQTQIRETHIHQVPVTNSNHGIPVITFISGGSSVPGFHGKQSKSSQIDSMSANDQLRTEQFIRLHKILKQCDEGKQIEYIRTLLHLSPTQLSKHAVELEKRTIQLSIEEAKEVQRMKALDILGKSVPAKNPIQQLNSSIPTNDQWGAMVKILVLNCLLRFLCSSFEFDGFWP